MYAWVFQVVCYLQVSPPKPCIHLSSPPYALHAPLISFFDLITRKSICLYVYYHTVWPKHLCACWTRMQVRESVTVNVQYLLLHQVLEVTSIGMWHKSRTKQFKGERPYLRDLTTHSLRNNAVSGYRSTAKTARRITGNTWDQVLVEQGQLSQYSDWTKGCTAYESGFDSRQREKHIPHLYSIQGHSEAHPDNYTNGTVGSFLGVQADRTSIWQLKSL
jgi:hypothetical protein